MWNVIKALMEGKRGADLYNALTPEQKKQLNQLAAANGISRRERRKLEQYAKRKIHR